MRAAITGVAWAIHGESRNVTKKCAFANNWAQLSQMVALIGLSLRNMELPQRTSGLRRQNAHAGALVRRSKSKWKGKVTRMCAYEGENYKFPAETDAYYDAVARQEEIYLEATEEEVRLILESDDRPPLPAESPCQTSERFATKLIAVQFKSWGRGDIQD